MTISVFALDAKTFAITHELPVTSVQVDNTLNGVGSWQAELPVSFSSVDGIELLTEDNFDPNRSVVAVVRDGIPIMLGLLESESGSFDENTETLRIGGPELALGYLSKRVWLSARSDSSDDVFTHATNVIRDSDFLGLGATIAVTFEPSATSGSTVTAVFDQTDRKTLLEYLQDLATINARFDYMTYATGSQSAGFQAGILLGAPSIYRRTEFVLEFGKNIQQLSYTKDGGTYANVVIVGGAKRGQFQPMATAVHGPALASYPYYMRQESFNDIIDDTQLQAAADRLLYVSKTTPRRFDVTINHEDPECQFGNWRLGDEFRLVANRGRLNIDSKFRVESWTISVSAEGSEEVKMSLFETGTM